MAVTAPVYKVRFYQQNINIWNKLLLFYVCPFALLKLWWVLVALGGRVTQRICELILSFVNVCSVERYDPSKDSWEMVASMADKRIHFGVGVMLGFIFVVGGHNGVSHLSSIERYDPHQNQWTVCRPMKEPRTGNNNVPISKHIGQYVFIVIFLK